MATPSPSSSSRRVAALTEKAALLNAEAEAIISSLGLVPSRNAFYSTAEEADGGGSVYNTTVSSVDVAGFDAEWMLLLGYVTVFTQIGFAVRRKRERRKIEEGGKIKKEKRTTKRNKTKQDKTEREKKGEKKKKNIDGVTVVGRGRRRESV